MPSQYDNPFLAYLEEEPKAGYFAYQNQWRTPNQKKYFQNQFAEIQNQYMGRLGQQILGGGEPNLRFTDFLKQYPWMQEFAKLPPSQRGENRSLYNPRTQRIFW